MSSTQKRNDDPVVVCVAGLVQKLSKWGSKKRKEKEKEN